MSSSSGELTSLLALISWRGLAVRAKTPRRCSPGQFLDRLLSPFVRLPSHLPAASPLLAPHSPCAHSTCGGVRDSSVPACCLSGAVPGELGSRQGFIPPRSLLFLSTKAGKQRKPVPDGAVLMDVAKANAACGLPGRARLSQKGPAEPGGAQQSPAVTSHLRRAPSRLCQSCS